MSVIPPSQPSYTPPPPSTGLNMGEWFAIWRRALTQPSAATFEELERHPQVTMTNSLIWIAIAGAIGAMMTRPDSRHLLGQIVCPAIVLAGEEDTLIPTEAAREIHRGIGGSQLTILPRCGHLASPEQPAEFNRAVGHFLENLV